MRIGKHTFSFDNVFITQTASVAGSFEAKGCLRDFFDSVLEDDVWGCKTHEKCEIKMQKEVIASLMEKNKLRENDIDFILGGDIINQIMATSFSAREYDISFCGLYNACATFGEALGLGATLVNNECEKVICISSSHYATAERLYRFPLELGTQPTPSSQWTVTGSGGVLLEKLDKCDENRKKFPKITTVTFGKIVDFGCIDPNNMGAAMAPAAADTMVTHFKETGRGASYYDMIITGDLGKFGRDTLNYLLEEQNFQCSDILNDCGCLVYSKKQKVGQGGSGAGCCSLVFASYIYKLFVQGEVKKILFMPTGALLSKDSAMQGESIPAISHAISIEME